MDGTPLECWLMINVCVCVFVCDTFSSDDTFRWKSLDWKFVWFLGGYPLVGSLSKSFTLKMTMKNKYITRWYEKGTRKGKKNASNFSNEYRCEPKWTIKTIWVLAELPFFHSHSFHFYEVWFRNNYNFQNYIDSERWKKRRLIPANSVHMQSIVRFFPFYSCNARNVFFIIECHTPPRATLPYTATKKPILNQKIKTEIVYVLPYNQAPI